MVYTFKAQTISKNVFCMLLLITFVKLSTLPSINISETDNSFSYSSNNELEVNPKFTKEINYLKIEVESHDTIEFVLSYYQDSTLNNRKQLSQSISGKAFIYLKKEQLKQAFYISIKSDSTYWDYTLHFIQKEKMELNLGEQYSYYVTEENKNMEFFIKGTPEVLYNNSEVDALSNSTYKLSIWARGSKKVNSEIINFNNQTDIKKEINGFNAYLLQLNELKELSYTFKVEGNPGDLIKVGTLFYSKDNLCQTIIKDHSMEIFGLLKDFVMEKVYFLTPKLNNSNGIQLAFETINAYDYSFYQTKLYLNPYNDELNIHSFYMDDEITEQFYLFQFAKDNSNEFKVYSPLILGGSYMLFLKNGEKIGLQPMISENNEYLTYQTTPYKGNHTSTMVTYTDYPFCKNKKNEVPLLQYYSSSISYNKNEYNNKLSPIDHNQTLLVLTCESKECNIYVNIYTEKNKPTIFPSMNYYRYIRKGNKDNFMIDLSTEIKFIWETIKWFINIEVINGGPSDLKISFSEKNTTILKNNNKILYEQNLTKLRDITLNIEATKKNIVYSIVIIIGEDVFIPQINYLIKCDNNLTKKTINFVSDTNRQVYYVGFYLLSELKVVKLDSLSNEKPPILNVDKYYQDLKDNFDVIASSERYSITKNVTKENSLFELSLFKYSNNNLDESIILTNNIERIFIFTENYTQFKAMYLLGGIKNDLIINIQLVNETEYTMDLFVNNVNKMRHSLNKTKDITLKSTDFPKDEYQPNKINLIITSNIKKNSIIKIKIKEKNDEQDKDKNNYLKYIILGGSLVGVIFILLIIVIVILCKSKKSYDNLREKVKSISFKADNDDDLLD